MKANKVFEVVRQNKPDLLFPETPVSKRKTKVAGFKTEEEARNFAIAMDSDYFHHEVRERVFRWVRRSGFVKGRGEMLGKWEPVHDLEAPETISLKTLTHYNQNLRR